MTTKLNTVEGLLKTKSILIIAHLANKFGIEVDILKKVDDIYSDVYGVNANKVPEGGEVVTKNVLFVRDDFSVLSLGAIGTLNDGYVYEDSDDISVGDTLAVKRGDVLVRHFQVVSIEGIGSTVAILKRIKISAVGD